MSKTDRNDASDINREECETTMENSINPTKQNDDAAKSENMFELPFDTTYELEDFQPETIYYGHTMTVFTSVTLIWIYALTHAITGSQLADLLVLINAHCLENIPALQSVDRFKNYFADFKLQMVKHYYCSFCSMNLKEGMTVCPNTFCSKELTKAGSKNYFIEFPIHDQLKNMYARPDFCENLKHRFQRKKRQANGIEDIYDGAIYQSLSACGGPLSNPDNISFTWNTDGVPVFKSSKSSVWPMYLMVNELPYKLRKEKCNMIFYGLWFGEAKPEVNIFCQPLLNSLKSLENEGLDVHINGKITNVKGFLICGTADLPARGTVLNMTQFNGKYSCSRCLQPGETCKIAERGHTHVFPYQTEDPIGPVRSHTSVKDHAYQAVHTNTTVMGIKGPSFLLGLKAYNFVHSTGIDYMHCVLLGVTKRLTSLWFSASNAKDAFSLTKHLSFFDKSLLSIKPPHWISRRPRSVSEHFKYWKASELRAWLFYYSIPILSSIMEPIYFFHYCSFVQAIWLLCQDSVTQRDLQQSYGLLNYFVYMMNSLYGERYMTLNTHSLLHLPGCVQDIGPLWVYSCFPFESLNGELLKLFHGTQYVDTQILSAVKCHQILPQMLEKLSADTKQIRFVSKFANKLKTSLGKKVDYNVHCIGSHVKLSLKACIKNSIRNFLGFKPLCLNFYNRLKVRNLILHSQNYTRVEKRNSYTVRFIYNNQLSYGLFNIFGIHRMKACECGKVCLCDNKIFAVIRKMNVLRETIIQKEHELCPKFVGLSARHVKVLKMPENGEVVVVDVHDILSLCVDIVLSDIHYVCEFPNTIECD